jgi:hypothetical protein
MLSRDGRYVFVPGKASIYRIPLSLDAFIPIRYTNPVDSTFQFAESADGKDLYVLGDWKVGEIWVIDETSGQLRKTISGVTFAMDVICVPGGQTPPGEGGSSKQPITEPGGKGKGPRPTHPIGTVEVHTEPGSLLLLDGNPVGNADTQGFLSLPAVPAGNHELVAKNDSYQDAHLQFELASGEDKPVSLPLTWMGGYLAVSVQPGGAAVTVAGTQTFTVGPAEVKCPPGTYTLTASLDGYSSQTRTIQIAAGEHHTETFALLVDPAVLARKLDGAKSKLAAGDPAGAEQDADAVLAQTPGNSDAAAIVAESAFQQGDMNRFVDVGAKAILGGRQVTVRTMHAHTVLALWIHPMDVTISESGITVVSNPPDSRCKIPPSVGFDLIQSAQVVRDPQRGFIELHIQYASKPHGAILHDLDFVPDSSQVVTARAPGQVFGSGTSNIQEPGNAGQTLNGILRLIIRAKR